MFTFISNVVDEESKLGSSEVPKLEEVGGTSRRRRDYRDSYHQLSSQRSTVQDGQTIFQLLFLPCYYFSTAKVPSIVDNKEYPTCVADYFDLSPPQQNDLLVRNNV